MHSRAQIQAMFDEALENIKKLGYEPDGYLDPVVGFSSRFRRKWAECSYHGYFGHRHFTIRLNTQLMYAKKQCLLETIYHEIIHTIRGCFNHGPNFKRIGREVMREYGYEITRCKSYEDMFTKKVLAELRS